MKKTHKMINHYSKWQYLVILFTVVILGLNALPNWFGEKAALHIQATSNQPLILDSAKVYNTLSQQGINVDLIEQQNDKNIVLLHDKMQQQQARNLLESTLGEGYSVAMAMESASPSWLKKLGVSPMQLGLDLRGGVQFVMNVDTQAALVEREVKIQQDLTELLKEFKVYGAKVTTTKDAAMTLHFASQTAPQVTQVVKQLTELYPELSTNKSGVQSISITTNQQFAETYHQSLMRQNIKTMRDRIEALGITEAVVQRQGTHFIRIELPGVQDPSQARRIIGATASLDFYPLQSQGGKLYKDKNGEAIRLASTPIMSGSHITDARSQYGEMGMPEVFITLDSAGGKLMSDFTQHNIGKPMATLFSEYQQNAQGTLQKESKIISVATIQAHLGARFTITGMENVKATQELAMLLKAGSLTAPVSIVEERTLGPSLGEQNINNGMAAIALGLAMMLVFMALWYRKLGLIANVALLLNLVCLVGLLSLVPGAVLTLPGIAGLVLTIGMAVDTNVLIFERIKEELSRGKSVALAIHHGYKNALSTIIDANITSLIIAIILFSVGYGSIKGFAITLGLGILTSMFTGIYVSRALVNAFIRQLPIPTKANKSITSMTPAESTLQVTQ
ncbi:protein translocase subunit SecD [Psychromonas arctica]|uniref:Protein translocase subunit SecD n=1 Tax=Psychromonas arctica TaxID=168275 RepID=A0ABU9H9K0_9GAMM